MTLASTMHARWYCKYFDKHSRQDDSVCMPLNFIYAKAVLIVIGFFFHRLFLLIIKFYLYLQEFCDKQRHVICKFFFKRVLFDLNEFSYFHMHIFRCTLTSPVYYLLLKVSLILMMNKIMNVMNIALLRTADICNGILSFLLINCQIKIIPEKIAVVIILGRAHNF